MSDDKTAEEIAREIVENAKGSDSCDVYDVLITEFSSVITAERQAKAELERRLGIAVECLEFAELRFSAMADSTINNSAPSASELIGLCNESALKIGLCIDEIRGKEGV
jgi:hypothetical protein